MNLEVSMLKVLEPIANIPKRLPVRTIQHGQTRHWNLAATIDPSQMTTIRHSLGS